MKTLILLLLASTASDAYYTHKNMLTGREENPLMRPFVHSTPMQILFFSADAGGTISLSRLLQKHHHPKLGDAFLAQDAAAHTAGTAYCVTHPYRRQP